MEEIKYKPVLSMGLIIAIIAILILQMLNVTLSMVGLYMDDRNQEDNVAKQNNLHFVNMTSSLITGVIITVITYLLMDKNLTIPKFDKQSRNSINRLNNASYHDQPYLPDIYDMNETRSRFSGKKSNKHTSDTYYNFEPKEDTI